MLDGGRIYIYTTNNRKIELVEGKDYYYKNGTAYYYNQPYNAVAYRLGQGNIQFNKSAVKGQSTITVKRANKKTILCMRARTIISALMTKPIFTAMSGQ